MNRSSRIYPQVDHADAVIQTDQQREPVATAKARYLHWFAIILAALLVIVCIITIPIVLTSKRNNNDSKPDESENTRPSSQPTPSTTRSNTSMDPSEINATSVSSHQRPASDSPDTTTRRMFGTVDPHATPVEMNNTKWTDTTMTTTNLFVSTSEPSMMIMLNGENDTSVALYNTTVGQPTDGFNNSIASNKIPKYAMDNETSTSYLNHGYLGALIPNITGRGTKTGFVVIPQISNASIARALRFATANDTADHDPIHMTLEGSNSTDFSLLFSENFWHLIYNGSTGINATHHHDRQTFGVTQNFTNTQRFASYRLLITALRNDSSNAAEYSEAQILGYF